MKNNVFVELTMTNTCNCHCSYCFEKFHDQNHRNIEEESRQTDILKKSCLIFDKDKYEWLTISFWGGEPFLNFDFIDNIIKSTYEFPFVRYNFYSNGTLTNEFIKFVNEPYFDSLKGRLRIQLSYDGEPIHTKMRNIDPELIFKTADLFKEHGISCEFKATLPFSCISDFSTCWNSYNALYEKYGRSVIYFPTIDTTTTDLNQLNEFENQLFDICKKEYVFYRKHRRYLLGWFVGHKFNCAIDNTLFIHNDGKLYYCHGCPYKEKNSNLIKGTTKNITTIFDAITTNTNDSYDFPIKCKCCAATYCAICHITQIKENDDPIKSWNSCRVNNTDRCKFFKIIGKYNRLLEYAVNYH